MAADASVGGGAAIRSRVSSDFFEAEGLLDDATRRDVRSAADEMAATVREDIYAAPTPHPGELFDHVYVDVSPALERQRDQLLSELQMADDRPEGPQR